jgi:hypothetical protein
LVKDKKMNTVTGFIEQFKLVLKAPVQEAFQIAFRSCTASHEGFNRHMLICTLFLVKVRLTKCIHFTYTYLHVTKQCRFFSTSP